LSGFNRVLILSADFNTTNPQHQNFHESSFNGQRVAACGQRDGQMEDRRDDANVVHKTSRKYPLFWKEQRPYEIKFSPVEEFPRLFLTNHYSFI
jgi:hypothetical protein